MTPNKKLEQETEHLGWGKEDIAERIGIDAETVGEWFRGESPDPYYSEKLCKLFGKDVEELGLTKDENGASHASNKMPIDRLKLLPLPVHTTHGLQDKKRKLRVGRLLMSITISIVVLLFAVGAGDLIIPKMQTKAAIGTLL